MKICNTGETWWRKQQPKPGQALAQISLLAPQFCLDFREYWDVRMGTGPEWEHVKVASTEQGPPLLQAEVHKRRESATQESRTLSVTCTACETEAG